MDALMKSIWVGLGAVIGANLRYWIGVWVHTRFSSELPWATFAINIAGSFLIGCFYAWETSRGEASVPRLIFAVGFCGGFTTFSAFSLESLQMIQRGAWLNFGLYALGSLVLTVAFCAIGFAFGSIIKA
jgi:fluoride exporter